MRGSTPDWAISLRALSKFTIVTYPRHDSSLLRISSTVHEWYFFLNGRRSIQIKNYVDTYWELNLTYWHRVPFVAQKLKKNDGLDSIWDNLKYILQRALCVSTVQVHQSVC